MMVTIFVRILGKINSKELWGIIYHCALYGDIMAEVTHKK